MSGFSPIDCISTSLPSPKGFRACIAKVSSACRWLVAVDEDSTLFYYCWTSSSRPAQSTHQPQPSNLQDQSNQSKSTEEVFRGSEENNIEERRGEEGPHMLEDDEVRLSESTRFSLKSYFIGRWEWAPWTPTPARSSLWLSKTPAWSPHLKTLYWCFFGCTAIPQCR